MLTRSSQERGLMRTNNSRKFGLNETKREKTNALNRMLLELLVESHEPTGLKSGMGFTPANLLGAAYNLWEHRLEVTG